jgi:hypothetical protein
MPTILLVTVYPCRNSYRLTCCLQALVDNPTFFHHKWAVGPPGTGTSWRATRQPDQLSCILAVAGTMGQLMGG